MPSTVELTSGIGATLQILALSIDVIHLAGQRDAAYDKKKAELMRQSKLEEEEKEKEMNKKNVNRASELTPQQNKIGITRGKSVVFDRFSIVRRDSVIRSIMLDSVKDVPEGADVEEVKIVSNKVWLVVNVLSFVSYFGAFLYFLIGCIMVGSGDSFFEGSDTELVFDAVPMGCVAVATFVHLLGRIQDLKRERFSYLQRTLYLFSFILIMLGCIYVLGTSDANEVKSTDIASVSVIIYLTLMSMIECKILPYPEVSTNSANSKRALLSRKALMIILKPYFWPDATATTAVTNRVRALLTWVFVISSKVCSLLGKSQMILCECDSLH